MKNPHLRGRGLFALALFAELVRPLARVVLKEGDGFFGCAFPVNEDVVQVFGVLAQRSDDDVLVHLHWRGAFDGLFLHTPIITHAKTSPFRTASINNQKQHSRFGKREKNKPEIAYAAERARHSHVVFATCRERAA